MENPESTNDFTLFEDCSSDAPHTPAPRVPSTLCGRTPWRCRIAAAVTLVVLQFVGIALSLYLGFAKSLETTNARVIQQFSVEEGCPINVGNPVSFLPDQGTVRRGAGSSLYRNAGQRYLTENIVSHAIAAVGTDALITAFETDVGTHFLTVALRPSGEGTGSAHLSRWLWLDFTDLGPVRPDAVLATSNTTFIVAGGGYGVLGVLSRNPGDPWASRVTLSPAVPYNMDSASSRPRRGAHAGSNSDSDRCSAAVLSPDTVAISYYDSGAGSGNATLMTRLGVLTPNGAGPWPGSSGDSLGASAPFPRLAWSLPVPYATAHMSHSTTALSSGDYLLAFPLDNNDASTEGSGFPLMVITAGIVHTGAPHSGAVKGIVLGPSAVLPGVRAHYLFSARSVSPTHAVCVFVDAGINDGIRGVVINVERSPEGGSKGALPDSVSFGSMVVINSGSGGAAAAGDGGGSAAGWRHLSLVPLSPPLRWWMQGGSSTVSPWLHGQKHQREVGRAVLAPHKDSVMSTATRTLKSSVADTGLSTDTHLKLNFGVPADGAEYVDDDGAVGDDDAGAGHTVIGRDRDGSPFSLVFSDAAWGGAVMVTQGELTPGGELIMTSPSFQVSTAAIPPLQPPRALSAVALSADAPTREIHIPVGRDAASAAVTATGSAASAAGGSSFYWVSATLLSTTQVIVMDSLTVTAALKARHQHVQQRRGGSSTAEPVLGDGNEGLDAPSRTHRKQRGGSGRWPPLCDINAVALERGHHMRQQQQRNASLLFSCGPSQLMASRRSATSRRRSGESSSSGHSRDFNFEGRDPSVAHLPPPPWPAYAVAVANLTLLEALHNPVGVALSYAGCGDSVRVLMSGLFDFSGGVPQSMSSSSSSGRFDVAYGEGRQAYSRWFDIAHLLGLGNSGDDDIIDVFAARAPGDATDTAGPFVAGKAYYADSRGRLIEGPYAGTLGLQNEMSGYISTIDSTDAQPGSGGAGAIPGDTSVPFDSFVGIGISATQLLVRPGP